MIIIMQSKPSLVASSTCTQSVLQQNCCNIALVFESYHKLYCSTALLHGSQMPVMPLTVVSISSKTVVVNSFKSDPGQRNCRDWVPIRHSSVSNGHYVYMYHDLPNKPPPLAVNIVVCSMLARGTVVNSSNSNLHWGWGVKVSYRAGLLTTKAYNLIPCMQTYSFYNMHTCT